MQTDFDYIIVGAGSAGSVLAERLSIDGRNHVLLVEEGGPPNWLSQMPKGFGKLLGDPAFTHYYPTTRAADAIGPTETWARGRMLGGSSALNGMVWIRGTREDYDAIGEAGNPGWSWAEMNRCLAALENHHLGAGEYRGADGPVAINTNPNRTRLADAFIAAGLGTGLDFKPDQNGPIQEGVGYAQWNIDKRGRRVSAARAFLDKAASRPNLEIRHGVRVNRVRFAGRRATGLSATVDGQTVEFTARRAIVLAAGTLITPKLLQLSGIGDGALLKSLGIAVVHDSPNVGQRMREHLTLALSFRLHEWQDSDNREYSGARLVRNIASYLVAGRGPLARGASEAIAFVRALPGANRPDAQIMFNPYSLDPETAGIGFEKVPGMQCYSYALRPESEGSVLIASADPAALPRIDPNYLATDRDQATAIAATRTIRRIMAQPALGRLVIGETQKTAWAETDTEIIELYSRFGHSGYHAVGTAGMGPAADDVVDHRLRVRGVEGLLVADCSIFKQIPSGNTNAPAMALGWRAAEIIDEDCAHTA